MTPSCPLAREAPWLAVVALAVVAVQVLAHEAPGFPFGSDWGQYLQGADALWRGDRGAPYPSWRGPLYMLLLGGIGQKLGYVVAGRLVSRLAAAVCVIAAGLAGRALAGRTVAAAAALLAAGFIPLQVAALWVNPYATMGATWGLAIAAGVATARWGRPWMAAAAGVAAAAAVATDPRGWLMVPLVLGLGVMAPDRPRWRAPAVLAAALALGLGTNAFFQRDLPHTPLSEAIRAQHVLSGEMVGIKTGPEHPLTACLSEDSAQGGMVTSWACARQLAAWNLERAVPRGHLPVPWALLALPLALLPVGWGRRRAMSAALAIAAPLATLLAGLAWVEWAPRYSAPWTVPLALLGPAALAWLLARGARPWRHALLLAASAAWGLTVMPSLRGLHDPQAGLSGEADLLAFAHWVDVEAGEGAAVFNCSQQPVDLLLLPRPTYARYQTAGEPAQCRAWAGETSPRALFLTAHNPYTGACQGECAGIEPEALGWRPVTLPADAPPNVRAWRR
ncbi:MAG: hypothetical protein ABIO70_21845 [Pseudomonadota bacterium]